MVRHNRLESGIPHVLYSPDFETEAEARAFYVGCECSLDAGTVELVEVFKRPENGKWVAKYTDTTPADWDE